MARGVIAATIAMPPRRETERTTKNETVSHPAPTTAHRQVPMTAGGVAAAATTTVAATRQPDKPTRVVTVHRPAHTTPGTGECTDEAAVTFQRTRSHIPATGTSAGRGMKAGGSTAGITVAVRRATIELVSIGNMGKGAGTGQSTIKHGTPIAHTQGAVDAMGGMTTTRGPTGESRITDARTGGLADQGFVNPRGRGGAWSRG
jgi:hypothetical protein